MNTKRERRTRRGAASARRRLAVSHAQPKTSRVARRVLIATDGSWLAGSALQLAKGMADIGAWSPEVVTVFEPLPVSVADVTLAAPAPVYLQDVTDSLLARIKEQLKRVGRADWPLSVEFGRPAAGIARAASDRSADLVVLGLGEHGKIARLLGAETATRVMRHVNVPVLAVAFGATRPFTAMVAMDFGDSSVRAAREALALLQPPGRLHLVHVLPRITAMAPSADAGWDAMYQAGVSHGFERVKQELGVREGIKVTSELRRGDVVESLLKVAKKLDADLIAAGSHSQHVIDRLLIGSTPAHLLRAAKCSVLVAPPLIAGN